MNQKNSKFIEKLRQRNVQMGRKGLRRKPPLWLYPEAIERFYTKTLLNKISLLEIEIKKRLIERLPFLVAQSEVSFDKRSDDFIDDIKAIMAALGIFSAQIFNDQTQLASLIGGQISGFNAEQYRRIIRATLGIDPIKNDEFLRTQLKLFAEQNASLIKSIPENMLKDVEAIAFRGMATGATIRDMTKEIESRFKVTRNRARLIARDQTSKLNSQLTELRQKNVGVIEYIWNSVIDERVRDSHRVLDGKICQWEDDTVYRNQGDSQWRKRSSLGGYVGTPGSDYQCRCFAEPIIEDIIELSKQGAI